MSTSVTLNLKLVTSTIKLLKEYDQVKCRTTVEFLEALDMQKEIPEDVVKFFMLLSKHKKFLDDIAEKIIEEYELKKANEWPLRVCIALMIFFLNRKNVEDIQKIFKAMNNSFAYKMIEFFFYEESSIFVARTGCTYFDQEYVLENVVRPLVSKGELIKSFYDNIYCYYLKRKPVYPKEVSKHVHTKEVCVVKKKPAPKIPENVPKKSDYKFKPTPIPKTTYLPSIDTLFKINVAKDKNWEDALKLYEEAKNCPIKAAQYKPKIIEEEKICVKLTPPKPIPKFNEVKIKKTTTTLLREAANLAKEKEVELKKLNDLLNGGSADFNIEAIEEEIRKEKEQKNIQDIERKHLEGLLTFEEAVLAKKKVVQLNQEKMEKFKEERLELIQKLLQWRLDEQDKIKQLVEKSQNIDKAAKEAPQKIIDEKQALVRLMDYESKKLKEDLQKKREEELQKKISLIQDIRVLHELKMTQEKEEFDPTDCPNLGLLCEMSLAELQERLKLMKIQMREDLEDKKVAILEEKKKRCEFIDNVKEFIEQSRNCKVQKIVPTTTPAKVLNTPEISALREKLHQVRKMNRTII